MEQNEVAQSKRNIVKFRIEIRPLPLILNVVTVLKHTNLLSIVCLVVI